MEAREAILQRMDEVLPKRDAQDLRTDVDLSAALQARLAEMIRQVRAGEREMPNWKSLYGELDEVAQSMGYEYGVPTPILDEDDEVDEQHALVLAKGSPLRMQQATRRIERDEYAEEMGRCGLKVRSSWTRLGDQECVIVDSPTGAKLFTRPMAGIRMRKWFDTSFARSRVRTLSADAELKAIELLRSRITESQFNSYMLNGCFPERSPRSDLFYVFRKGLPTLVLSYHKSEEGNVIAALCMHPMGYYQYTFAGVMTPTDEVIAHLLTMRSDERRYWAKSGQWPVTDLRAGV